MNLIKRILQCTGRVEEVIMVVGIGVMATTLVIDVVSREVFSSGMVGASEFAVFMLVYSAFAGFAVATAHGGHLRPTFADDWLPRAWNTVVERLSHLVSASVFLVLGGAGLMFVLSSHEFAERSAALEWFTWPVQAAIPLAFALAGLRHIAYARYPVLAPRHREGG